MLRKRLAHLIHEALLEDIGVEDITTKRTVPADARCRARIIAKQDGVLSGIAVFREVFQRLQRETEAEPITDWDLRPDGYVFKKGEELGSFTVPTRLALTGERTALNFLQRLAGVATLTARFVAEAKGTGARVCDTRKTTPLLRELEKEAVAHGGGVNHRFGLFDGLLIKENHIHAAGGVRKAIDAARGGSHHLMRVEVEVENLAEVEEAIAAEADVIMLDNMSLEDMREAVAMVSDKNILLEASGNATLDRVKAMGETGVDLISVGAITHSAPAVDVSLLIESIRGEAGA